MARRGINESFERLGRIRSVIGSSIQVDVATKAAIHSHNFVGNHRSGFGIFR
jgi:hypothetical protein